MVFRCLPLSASIPLCRSREVIHAPEERMPDPTDHNPMQKLLRRQLGMDVFALDGDDTELWESWQDRPRRRETPEPETVTLTEKK